MKGILICSADLIKRHFKQNIILMIQIALTVMIFVGFIGRIQYIFSTKDIANTFSNSKALYYYPFSFTDSEQKAEDIIQKKDLNVSMVGEAEYILVNCNDELLPIVGYNDTLSDYANLKLSSGRWFDEQMDGEIIPLISTTDKYLVNDRITVKDRLGKSFEAIVIGTIDKDGYVLAFNKSASRSVISIDFFVSKPYSYFIAPYNSEIYSSLSDQFDMLLEMEVPRPTLGKIITYENNEDVKAIEKAFAKYGTTVDIDRMVENYRKDIRFNLLINGIILAVFAILTATGIGGINGIQSRLDRRNYIVYYILGMSRKQCAMTELIRSFSVVTLGFIVAVFLYLFKFVREFLYSSEMIINIRSFLSAFAFLLLICCFVSIKYVIDLGKGSLIERYKNQD